MVFKSIALMLKHKMIYYREKENISSLQIFLFTVNSVYAHTKMSIHIPTYMHRYLCAIISVIDTYAYQKITNV